MSWTSHAYHVAKDFQTLGAALIAFGAAALTFYSQNRVAARAAKTAIEVQDRTIKEQRLSSELKEARFRLAFAIEFGIVLGSLSMDFSHRDNQAKIFMKFAHTEDEGVSVKVNATDISWIPFLTLPSLIEKYDIFSTPLTDLSRLDRQTQGHFQILRHVCVDVDAAINNAIQASKPSGFVLSAYVTNISNFASIFFQHEEVIRESNSLMRDMLYERRIDNVAVRPS